MELSLSRSSSHPPQSETRRENSISDLKMATMTMSSYVDRTVDRNSMSTLTAPHYQRPRQIPIVSQQSPNPNTLPSIVSLLNEVPGPQPINSRPDSRPDYWRNPSPASLSDTVSTHSDSHSLHSVKRRKTSVEGDYQAESQDSRQYYTKLGGYEGRENELPSPHCSPPSGPSWRPRTSGSLHSILHNDLQCLPPPAGMRSPSYHSDSRPATWQFERQGHFPSLVKLTDQENENSLCSPGNAGGPVHMLPPTRPAQPSTSRSFEPQMSVYAGPSYTYSHQAPRGQPSFYSPTPFSSGYSQPPFHGGYNHDMGHDSKQRKRRGNLPKETTDKLRAWFHAHIEHPYPTEDEKQELMRQTCLQMNQISNWFINARRRQLPSILSNAKAETDLRNAHGVVVKTERHLQDTDREVHQYEGRERPLPSTELPIDPQLYSR